jgi:cobalt-zinc-cadmium efflux system outer membrane protein
MHVKRCIVASALTVSLCLSCWAQQSTGLIVEDLVKTSFERNQDLLAARERVVEAEALLRQAGVRPVPTLEVETSTGRILGSRGESEYSAAYFYPIETGGKRSKRQVVAEKSVAIARAEVKERERQLRFDVRNRFVDVALQEVKASVIQSLTPLNEDTYRLTQQRVELGDAAPLEQQLLLSEINRAKVQETLVRAEGEAALAELRAVVGDSIQTGNVRPDFQFPERIADLSTLQQAAIRERGDLHILLLLEETALAERESAIAEGRPDVTVSARYTHSNSAFDQFGLSSTGTPEPLRDTDNILTFGVSIPLSSRKRVAGLAQAAESRQLQQQLRRQHLTRAIPQEVEAAYRRWEGATRSLELLRTGVIELSEKNLTVIREAYRLGQMRLLDVLNEQRRLVDLRLAYVDAQAEAAHALIDLERAVGGRLP